MFSCDFSKIFQNTFLQVPPGDCFWFSTSSVEVTASNQVITVLIDVLIWLHNPLVKVFHDSVKG